MHTFHNYVVYNKEEVCRISILYDSVKYRPQMSSFHPHIGKKN